MMLMLLLYHGYSPFFAFQEPRFAEQRLFAPELLQAKLQSLLEVGLVPCFGFGMGLSWYLDETLEKSAKEG